MTPFHDMTPRKSLPFTTPASKRVRRNVIRAMAIAARPVMSDNKAADYSEPHSEEQGQ